MDQLQIGQIALSQVMTDEQFDVLTVRIDASASDYQVSLKDGRKVSSSKVAEPFSEYWSFLRRHGARTQTGKPGLMEGNCPNCGGAVEMNQAAKCDHCGAHLRSGEFDWVLAEITQACEWQGAQPTRIPGVEAYREQDPSFNLQHLEDRSSVLFWRKMMSDQKGDVKLLRKVSSNAFSEEREAFFKKLRTPPVKGNLPPRQYFGECAVGSVDTLGIIPGDEVDRALVEVRWSGTHFKTDDQGPPQRGDTSSVFRSLLLLSRKAGVRSDLNTCVTSAHCPACGAPEAGGVSNACEYCGAVLNDGTKDWILENLLSRFEPRALNLMEELRGVAALKDAGPVAAAGLPIPGVDPEPVQANLGSADLLAWMIKVLLADGRIDVKEKEMLVKVAGRRDVPRRKLENLLRAAQSGHMELPEPSSQEEGRVWLSAMAAMALVDGALDRAELGILQATGAKLGLAAYDIKILIQKEKARLYKEAKGALRQEKARKKGFDG